MRFGFIGSRPLYFLPFSSFPPLHTSVFFFSFVCTCTGPGLSVYVHNLRRLGLYNEAGFHWLSLCTWFPFVATTHAFVPSGPFFMSSFFCLVARALTLCPDLSASRPPLGGRVCVCVCNLWSHKVPVAGGMRLSRKRIPTKLCAIVEARSDQPGVPTFGTVD